ncbi:N-acetylmuramoyl-L-alanine amidase [Rivularia sp. PCC 7116]|uniref:N-acetylmuramoyl-L-alanine amidase n=1 Tax=Rivularia sp. PCC 7116 TaxID=373994 RepID=UPI00029F25C0|nr:N-acetylmuramoyl-L-alanine amidase [Rivularia sp. PCC 7116]AFY54782.1 N-acetylmuramoyl-L-alanine amidase [Rivularia sp. PCC 7116]
MFFAIDIGHNCPPYDTGARTNKYSEDALTKLVGELVIGKLRLRKHKVISVTPQSAYSTDDSLMQRARKANQLDADYFISIHFNAFSSPRANGSEVYVYDLRSAARPLAQSVVSNIASLGFFNRGVKKARFRVLELTAMPAILIECCFISSDKDMRLFNAEKMATAIVDGLVGKEEITTISGTLKVRYTTYLKPSSDQSSNINPSQLKVIQPGDYPGKLVAKEESHYAVELENEMGSGLREVDYIYTGHSDFIAD